MNRTLDGERAIFSMWCKQGLASALLSCLDALPAFAVSCDSSPAWVMPLSLTPPKESRFPWGGGSWKRGRDSSWEGPEGSFSF